MNAARAAASAFPPCLWMQAGVVQRKFCTRGFRCRECPFDRALGRLAAENRRLACRGERPAGGRGRIEPWPDRLRRLPVRLRPCVHHLAGRIPFRACTGDYRCSRCEFDQYFAEEFRVFSALQAVAPLAVEGLKIPQGVYLHPGHVWLEPGEGGEVRLGLDDFAWKVLCPKRVETPLTGARLARGRPAFVLHRGARRLALSSPLDGVVTAVNPAMRERTAGCAPDPYAADWVLRAQADDLSAALSRLHVGPAAAAHLGAACRRLADFLAARRGPLAADGGFLDWKALPELLEPFWEELARSFFLAGSKRKGPALRQAPRSG